MHIDHQAWTDVGRRSNNEDAYITVPELGLYVVADGMGGYEGGEVASRVALASLQAYFELLHEGGEGIGLGGDDEEIAIERMSLAIRIADREVGRRAVGKLSRMGTTLAALIVEGDRVMIAHVGDSRVYRLREGELSRMTLDHSLIQQMLASGDSVGDEEMERYAGVITQAIGAGPDARPDISVHDVMPGDRFLLCSDGLSDVLDDELIAWGLTRTADVAQELVDYAYDAGSFDNITAVVITVSE